MITFKRIFLFFFILDFWKPTLSRKVDSNSWAWICFSTSAISNNSIAGYRNSSFHLPIAISTYVSTSNNRQRGGPIYRLIVAHCNFTISSLEQRRNKKIKRDTRYTPLAKPSKEILSYGDDYARIRAYFLIARASADVVDWPHYVISENIS